MTDRTAHSGTVTSRSSDCRWRATGGIDSSSESMRALMADCAAFVVISVLLGCCPVDLPLVVMLLLLRYGRRRRPPARACFQLRCAGGSSCSYSLASLVPHWLRSSRAFTPL